MLKPIEPRPPLGKRWLHIEQGSNGLAKRSRLLSFSTRTRGFYLTAWSNYGSRSIHLLTSLMETPSSVHGEEEFLVASFNVTNDGIGIGRLNFSRFLHSRKEKGKYIYVCIAACSE